MTNVILLGSVTLLCILIVKAVKLSKNALEDSGRFFYDNYNLLL